MDRIALARLRITSADGKGFTQLAPLMATFAHLVGFNQDYKTAIHMHPKETDRGAPGCAGWTGTGVSYFMRCGPASFVFSLKCKSKGVHDSLLSASGSRHEPRVNLKLVYRNLATADARHPHRYRCRGSR
ncbi:MAG: hypothetical protein AUG81_11050 [Verrucomicrobia bacterium 13_1_20CM_4_54_11]|nr:MAG: hypothetical protein AUG81_11050 [Verrucomicrobia bacterium 13_1_20CM_4_54_11]